MSIDEQPMNVYWSGKRTETSNTFKITNKGSVAEYTDLPSSDNQKGDKYEVTDDGSDYIWNGSAWNRLGAEKYAYEDIVGMPNFALDANVVHMTGEETIAGLKKFSDSIGCYTIRNLSDSENIVMLGGTGWSKGARIRLYGKSSDSSAGCFSMGANDGTNSPSLSGSPDGSLTWNGQTIQTTSDARLKTALETVNDDVLDAWGDVEWGQFQFLDAVIRKGDDARLHLGVIAQRIKAVFEAHGLDACTYGILCYDRRDAQDVELRDGTIIHEDAVDLWTVRYAEALAMEAAFQRRRADRLEARIETLEALASSGRQ